MRLEKNERIVTAYAQRASGPGWSNMPVWVIVRDANGNLREECIQPDEQTAEIAHLFHVSEAAHFAMVAAVERAIKR